MFKKLSLLTALLLALLMLSGCYKIKSDLTLNPTNETVSGVLGVSVPTKYFKAMGDQLPSEDLPAGVTVKEINANGMQGYSYTLTDVPMSELSASDSPLPIKVARDGDAYVLTGDFTQWFFTTKSLKQDGIKVKGEVPAPQIDFKFTFPDPVTDAPKGTVTDGNTVKLSGPWVKSHKKFRIAAAHNFDAVPVPSFKDFPSADRSVEKAYPLPLKERNELPLFFFGLMIAGGLITIILAHYGHVSRAPRDPKSKQAKKAKKK